MNACSPTVSSTEVNALHHSGIENPANALLNRFSLELASRFSPNNLDSQTQQVGCYAASRPLILESSDSIFGVTLHM